VELPSISIITPCMNAATTITETVQSVRAQGYPHVEHIVVDGGSTDRTVELLDSTPHVRWISERDQGRVDAANKGVGLATGDVIAWLNADDRYEPGTLHAVGRALAENPQSAWVTGYCRIIDGGGREIRRAVTSYKNFLLRHWSVSLYLTQNFVSDPATFVRRSALEEVGILDPRYRRSHDYDLWLRIAHRFGSPVVLRRPLASFRMAEGTLSMGGFEDQFAEHAEVARVHGTGHPVAVALNRWMSALIVAVYRVLRVRRRLTRPRT
jgi:glycosyltransferase involved in cell wall biosynthesis